MRTILITMAAAAAFTTGLRAGETYRGTAAVTFKGYSTLHDFEGTVTVPLVVTHEPKNGGDGVLTAKAGAEVAKMSTQHDERDEKMRVMFNSAANPLIDVQVKGASSRAARPASKTITARGGKQVTMEQAGVLPVSLTMAGTTRTVTAETRALKDDGKGHVEFDMSFRVSLKEFGLKPPSALLGAVSVKDAVDVKVHVSLDRK